MYYENRCSIIDIEVVVILRRAIPVYIAFLVFLRHLQTGVLAFVIR